MKNFENIAVVIDADNTQYSKVSDVLRNISTRGRITVKRAYGNWQKDSLTHWEDVIKKNAIHAMQQYDYVRGKNATDMAMVIDTMDLLYKGIYDAFAIVSSDSDFTPLAIRLRETGIYVMGVGKETTAESFKKSCDDFIVLENLSNDISEAEILSIPEISKESEEKTGLPKSVHRMLREAYDAYKDEHEYVNIGAVGSYIKRIKPDFDTRTYGYKKLSELISDFPQHYEVHSNSHGCTYKCLRIVQKEDMQTIHKLMRQAYMLYKDDSGYAHIGSCGCYLMNNLPGLNIRQYGYKSISDLLIQCPKLYQIKKANSSILFKCVK